jgi:O-antigen/teichoic acid export membrane protein
MPDVQTSEVLKPPPAHHIMPSGSSLTYSDRTLTSFTSAAPNSASARLIRNTLLNGCGKLANFATLIILSPILLSRLGAEQFGLWTLVIMFSGHFGMLDLGFGAALTKYVAQYKATNQLQFANLPFTAALLGYGASAVALMCGLWWLRFSLFKFFSVPRSFWEQSNYLIPGMVLIFFLTSILGVMQSTLNGLQEMAVTNLAVLLQVGCSIALTLGFLHGGLGLLGVVLANTLSLAIAALFLSFFVIRYIPGLRLEIFFWSPQYRSVLRFGAMVQLAKISSIVSIYADRVLIGHFLGLIALAQYQLGYTVVSAMRGTVLLLASAVMPATSDLAARNDRNNLQELYRRGTKYMVLVTLGITSVIITLAPRIIRVWLDRDDSVVAMIVCFLAVGQLAHVLTGLGTSMCEGLGSLSLTVKFGIGLTLLQILLGVLAIRYFGLIGLLVSTAIVLNGTSILFLYKFNQIIPHARGFLWLRLLRVPVAAAVVASVGVWLLASVVVSVNPLAIPPAVLLGSQIGLLLLTYSFFVLKSGYLDAFDKSLAAHLPGAALWSSLLFKNGNGFHR